MFTLTREQVRSLDRRAIEEFGVPSVVLMENAGRGAAEIFAKLNPNREPTLILCGHGNNGGDGFVIARHLELLGFPVEVLLFAEPGAKLSPDCEINYQIAKRAGIPIHASISAQAKISSTDWIIDALFGTGLDRPLAEPYDELIAQINASGCRVLAIDLPSGLDCDTGKPLGPTIRASHTVTFVAWKKGFLNLESREWTGEIHVADIGAPKRLIEEFRQRSDSPSS